MHFEIWGWIFTKVHFMNANAGFKKEEEEEEDQMSDIKMSVSSALEISWLDLEQFLIYLNTMQLVLFFLLTVDKIQTVVTSSIYAIHRSTRWDLEAIGSLVNSKAVLKLPLPHPVGLPEKCTCCITDQLTLSAVPCNDWQRTLRKLQTFTGADKTRFSPHTHFSTLLCLDTF